jgi:zinc protease
MQNRTSPKIFNSKTLTLVFCFVVIPLILILLSVRPAIASTPKHFDELTYKPLPELKLPPYEQFKLKNGMTVFLMEDHELPLVSGNLMVRTGSRNEPGDRTGLASITGNVLRSGGTVKTPANPLNELLEQKAASIESGISVNAGTVSFSSLTEDLPQVFDLFTEVVQNPALPQEKIDLTKFQVRGGIARRNDQANGILGREFRKLIYGATSPYARTVEYTTIDRITQSDIQNFYQSQFQPENFLLGIIGDINPAEMKKTIEAKFGRFVSKSPSTKPAQPATIQQAQTSGIFFANKPELTQSSIQIGHLGGKVNDRDYPALSVMNDILNGFGGRLFNEVRSRQGLAYSVYAAWSPQFDYPGTFVAGGDTKSESTVPFIRSVVKEIDRIRTEPVSNEELQRAKDSVINSFVFNFDDPAKVLSRVMRYEYFGYPKDYLFQYQKAVVATTVQDIQQAAQRNLKPSQLVTMVVGNDKAIVPALATLNQTVKAVDITIPGLKSGAQ